MTRHITQNSVLGKAPLDEDPFNQKSAATRVVLRQRMWVVKRRGLLFCANDPLATL